MKCQFLCPKHVRQLNERLEATPPIWQRWINEGEAALERKDHALATQYFGCAFDLATLLIDAFTAHAEVDGMRHIDRLLISGRYLCQSLVYCGYWSLRFDFIGKIRALLQREQRRTPCLSEALMDIDWRQFLERSGSFFAVSERVSVPAVVSTAGQSRLRLN